MQDHINRIQDLKTKVNSNHDKSIINSNWLKELSEKLSEIDSSASAKDYFKNSLDLVGIDLKNTITQTLTKNLNILEPQYIAIGEALFKKDNDKVKNIVDNYLKNLTLCQNKIVESTYNKDDNNKANYTPIYIVSAVIGLLIMGAIAILMKQNARDVNENNDGDTFIQKEDSLKSDL